jgi:glycosyltransferase involved in cell wall biosynthesis
MWLVAPANTKEDMGLTPIEARSVGVPAIVTRDGGLPESGGPAALLCAPGDVRDLAMQLELAASMPDSEYRERSALARDSLRSYLRPMSDYVAIYERLTAARSWSAHRAA